MIYCFYVAFMYFFFVPQVDVNRGGVGVQISNAESMLNVAQWVWMAPLFRFLTITLDFYSSLALQISYTTVRFLDGFFFPLASN